MLRLLAPLLLLLLPCAAGAQQNVTLTISVEQAMLITNTLRAIGCQNVEQMIVCDKAKTLLEAIQRQAREQAREQAK